MKTKKIIISVCLILLVINICIIVGLIANYNTRVWILGHTPGFPKEKLERYIAEYDQLQQEITDQDKKITTIQTEMDSLKKSEDKQIILINRLIQNNCELIKIYIQQQMLLAELDLTLLFQMINILIFGILCSMTINVLCSETTR